MAKIKKKTSQIPVSLEHSTQAQHILDRYHEIAENLHASKNQEQAEAALAEINNMPEGVQMALLKALSKERHSDAADVLIFPSIPVRVRALWFAGLPLVSQDYRAGMVSRFLLVIVKPPPFSIFQYRLSFDKPGDTKRLDRESFKPEDRMEWL